MSKPIRFLALLGSALHLLSAAPVQAQSMRCRNDLANVGDNKAAVLQKCGEPAYQDSFCKPQEELAPANPGNRSTVVTVNSCEKVDEWTYNPGRGQFMTTLRFESGRLTKISYGDRVK